MHLAHLQAKVRSVGGPRVCPKVVFLRPNRRREGMNKAGETRTILEMFLGWEKRINAVRNRPVWLHLHRQLKMFQTDEEIISRSVVLGELTGKR